MKGKWVPGRPGGAEKALRGALLLMGKRVPNFLEPGARWGRQTDVRTIK